MNIKSFFKLVEIQTKAASIIPYLLGTVYAIYKFDNFNTKQAVILFLSMIIFDMTTTAINNYVDYSKAIKKEGFGYEEHNAITKYNLKPEIVSKTILIMLLVSATLGIILFINTDITILLVGVLCFGIGIMYSFGPIPISRTPFGEIFSGLTMGFLITFLAVYIHIYDMGILDIGIGKENLIIMCNIRIILSIFILSIPTIVGISNIMLANNICDMDEDLINKRFTLPIFIGREKALMLFKYLYYIGFFAIILGVIIKVLPIVSLITLFTFVPMNKNIKKFMNRQTKKDTFVLAVKNFIINNLIYIGTLFLGVISKIS